MHSNVPLFPVRCAQLKNHKSKHENVPLCTRYTLVARPRFTILKNCFDIHIFTSEFICSPKQTEQAKMCWLLLSIAFFRLGFTRYFVFPYFAFVAWKKYRLCEKSWLWVSSWKPISGMKSFSSICCIFAFGKLAQITINLLVRLSCEQIETARVTNRCSSIQTAPIDRCEGNYVGMKYYFPPTLKHWGCALWIQGEVSLKHTNTTEFSSHRTKFQIEK